MNGKAKIFGILLCVITLNSCYSKMQFILYPKESGYEYNSVLAIFHKNGVMNEIKGTRYNETYFIKNFRHTKKNEAIIDSFVCLRKSMLPDSILNYSFAFYKETKYTNTIFLEKHPKRFYEGNWLIKFQVLKEEISYGCMAWGTILILTKF